MINCQNTNKFRKEMVLNCRSCAYISPHYCQTFGNRHFMLTSNEGSLFHCIFDAVNPAEKNDQIKLRAEHLPTPQSSQM